MHNIIFPHRWVPLDFGSSTQQVSYSHRFPFLHYGRKRTMKKPGQLHGSYFPRAVLPDSGTNLHEVMSSG